MEFVFEWKGKNYKCSAIWIEKNKVPGYNVIIGKRTFHFIGNGSDCWSSVPFIKTYELKNRIIAAILSKKE